jgi:hypothetical protein
MGCVGTLSLSLRGHWVHSLHVRVLDWQNSGCMRERGDKIRGGTGGNLEVRGAEPPN